MVRGPLSMVLQFDRRLARIVARTTEPMLGQMRLAWWREALGKPMSQRPKGDAVLDGLGVHWQDREAALVRMVDAWEVLVTSERLGPDQAAAFAEGRGAFFAALAPLDAGPATTRRLAAMGVRWALADAAAAVSDPDERAVLIAAAEQTATPEGRIPANLRGLAVLDALATRAIRRGGRSLMEGRGAPLAALRAGIFRT